MSYTPAPQWHHGDYATAAKLNQYKDGLDAINATLGAIDYEYPLIHRTGDMHTHYFINLYRYLVYRGVGALSDPNNDFESVSLSNTDGAWIAYDLAGVEWIVQGKLYEVQGVTEAYESSSGA
jgi:hypothetical protein